MVWDNRQDMSSIPLNTSLMPTAEAVIDKFHRVAAPKLGQAARERVIAEALALPKSTSPERLMQLLVPAA